MSSFASESDPSLPKEGEHPRPVFTLPAGDRHERSMKGSALTVLGAVSLIGSMKTGLSTKSVKVPYTEKLIDPAEAIAVQWKMSGSDRMRLLDEIHKHAPLPEECEMLNIPNDRLDLHRTQDILFLSGGCCGVRFTSDEMALIVRVKADLQPIWDSLDKQFACMEAAQKKKVLTGGPYAMSNLASKEIAEEDKEFEAAVRFHATADAYLHHMHKLQQLIKNKQTAIKKCDAGAQLTKFDKDPDASMGKAMPDWLSTILTKFHSLNGIRLDAAGGDGDSKKSTLSLKTGVTIGKLAAFVSGCIVGSISCTDDEWSAVSDLLHASNDTHTMFTIDGRMVDRASGHESSDSSSALQPKSRTYWATRVFNFLAALTELKTVVKDERSVHVFA